MRVGAEGVWGAVVVAVVAVVVTKYFLFFLPPCSSFPPLIPPPPQRPCTAVRHRQRHRALLDGTLRQRL